MPASLVNVPFGELRSLVAKTLAENPTKKVYVYAYASNDPATCVSWCPDCVRAGPIVHERFQKLENAVVLEAATGDRPTWKDPANIYRTDEVIALTAVPTLIQWTQDGPKARLVENECEDAAKLDAFFKQ